jgi:RNA polymerase sigma-70 factor (ECF subfamily)
VYTVVVLVLIADPPGRAELDDATLARARRGDAAAWRALVERHQRPVFALLGRMLGVQRHLVEDVAQETFLRVFRALPKFDPNRAGRLSSWILTIATRLALDVLRRRPIPVQDVRDHEQQRVRGTGPDRGVIGEVIARAVARLSPDHRAVLLLREVYGLDYDEIARALAVAIGTVRSRLARARAELRAALEEVDRG